MELQDNKMTEVTEMDQVQDTTRAMKWKQLSEKERYKIEIDTHTADGVKVALEKREAGIPVICLETALPAKFESSMIEALGRKPARPASLEGIEKLPQRFVTMDVDASAVKQFIAEKIGA